MWECMSGYGCNWGGMGFGMIGMSLFWILLIVVLVLLVKGLWDAAKAFDLPAKFTPVYSP